MASLFSRDEMRTRSSARTDLIAIGIALAALLGFAALGNYSFKRLGEHLVAFSSTNSNIIVGLLLLNVALTVYGWRRYRDAAREVVERTAAEQRAHTLAATDPLTGFLNRRSLSQATSELLARANRRKQAIAMLIIDIDGFKTVNDVHGHLTGDNLLRVAADVITQALPRDAVAARLGGDEFGAAFAFDRENSATVDAITETIVERLGKPFDLAGVHTHVSASVGVAMSEAGCSSVEAIARRADIAMHAAKKLGRSQHIWFDASMERELQYRNAIEAGLRGGIPAGQFVPYFEQQIDLATGELQGFEMLARWNHPERGVILPDDFISIAEECGLIGELSMSVMRQALEEARDWDPSLSLSVNISPVQLKDPWLAQKLMKLLVETRFPPERLEVEITESSLFENLGLAQAIVNSLKNQGIRLALDDFGTGYSSLVHLRALPFDRIKIDRSFVSSINENAESAAIVTAITRLGESLDLEITAEGIEDEQIAASLSALGAYQGQGWLFGRPISGAAVRKLLADRQPTARPRKNVLPIARRTRPAVAPRPRRSSAGAKVD